MTFTYKVNDGLADSNVAMVTIVVYGSPAVGQFVIGNLANYATGQPVIFWGAQWDQANPMSGGPASDGFKGYDSDSTKPTCGGT